MLLRISEARGRIGAVKKKTKKKKYGHYCGKGKMKHWGHYDPDEDGKCPHCGKELNDEVEQMANGLDRKSS